MKRWLTFGAAALAATTLIAFSLLPASAHITSNVEHTFNHIKNKMEYEVVTLKVSVQAETFMRDTANCPKGKEMQGGGAQVAGEGTDDSTPRSRSRLPEPQATTSTCGSCRSRTTTRRITTSTSTLSAPTWPSLIGEGPGNPPGAYSSQGLRPDPLVGLVRWW